MIGAPCRKILCIEDDRETAALIAEELADRGYQTEVAHNGREGLDAILRTSPDLVLADVNMPVMSGFDLLARLTAVEPRFLHMPFVFLTALADHDNELKGWQLGADDYVTKPVDFDVLAAVIGSRLKRVTRRAVAENCGSWRPRARGADLGGTRQDVRGNRANPGHQPPHH